MTKNLRKMVYVALLTALATALTFFPKVPTPTGYVHFGDSIIYIASIFLGPIYGAVVGAIGHSLADYMGGYAIFVIPTFIIKGLMGFVAGYIAKGNIKGLRLYLAFLSGLVIVTAGYFIAEIPMFGVEAALVSLVSSPVQWLMSVAASAILLPILVKLKFK